MLCEHWASTQYLMSCLLEAQLKFTICPHWPSHDSSTAHSASCFHHNFVTYSFSQATESLESVRSKVCLQCRESKNRGYDGWLGRRGEGGVTKARGSKLIVKEARSLAAVQQCVQTLSWCARQVRRSLTRRRAKELPSFLNLPFTQRQLAIAKMNTLMKLINANWKPWSPQYRYSPEVGIKVQQQPRNDIIIFLQSCVPKMFTF